MYLIGYDIGSSSVKASMVDAESSQCLVPAFYPKKEMAMSCMEAYKSLEKELTKAIS
jgi:xylulokinase